MAKQYMKGKVLSYKQFWLADEIIVDGDFIRKPDAFSRFYPLLNKIDWLYIRKPYRDLSEEIESLYLSSICSSREYSNVVVTGTPGVGKSTFLLYQLMQAKAKGRNVIVQRGSEVIAFLSEPEKQVITKLQDEEIRVFLEEISFLYFYDPEYTRKGPARVVPAFTVVFASMFEDNMGMLNKAPHDVLYMPVWSLEELLKCGQRCYPSCSPDQIEREYKKWGGSPMCVFQTSHVTDVRLAKFLSSKGLDEIVEELSGTQLIKHDHFQWLVHIHVTDGNYRIKETRWPSDYIMEKVSEVINDRKLSWREEFSHSILHGHLYERSVIKELSKDHEYTATCLQTKQTVTIPPTKSVRYFTNKSDIDCSDETVLWLPCEPNKAAVDCIKGDWMFQITLRASREIKGSAIADIAKQIKRESCRYCFCVPQERCSNYYSRKQRVLDDPIHVKIEQFKAPFF